MPNKYFIFTLVLVVLVAVLLRFPYLDQFPPSMLPDEAALGYNAMSIVQTGKDEWGTSWPIIFHSFGDNKPPAFVYTTSLLYLVTGWTPVLPRLTSALSGVLIVILLTLWLRRITASDAAALSGGLITAVSPWTVHLSRSALESNLGLLFFLAGLYGLERTRSKSSKVWVWFTIVLTACMFALSSYSFHSYRLVTPVYLLILTSVSAYQAWRSTKGIKAINTSLALVTTLVCILCVPGLLIGGSTTRFSQTSLLQFSVINNIMALHRDTCHEMSTQLALPLVSRACQLTWNPTTIGFSILYQSFLDHVQPSFLFVTGDPGFARNPTQKGLLFSMLLPFFILGAYVALRHFKQWYFLYVGYIVSIVPSALTGPTHATRLSPLIPFVIGFCVIGVQTVARKFRFVYPAVACVLLFSGGFFMLEYSETTYGKSQDFVGHSRELATLAYQYNHDGYVVYIDPKTLPEPHIYLAFWNQVPAQQFQVMQKNSTNSENGFSRPTQLGDSIFFKEPSVNEIVCNPKIREKIVFFVPTKLNFTPNRVILNKTNVHTMAFVYELASMRSQPLPLSGICGVRAI